MKRSSDMLHGPLAIGILQYTIPIILTSYLQLLFNAADLVVVGRFNGSAAVAAVGVTGSITSLMLNLFMGLSVGAGVTVAHALGSREPETVSRTVHTAVLTALIGGVFLTVMGIALAPQFLRWMDTPESVLPLASVYVRIFFGGITFNLLYNYCTAILRAAGDTQSPLIVLLIAGVINVILNVVFVAVFDLSVAGVALATTISQLLSAAAVSVVLMRRRDACRLYPNRLKIYGPQLRKIIRIGLPAGIQSATFSVSNVIIQSSINGFGEAVVSGNAAVSNIDGFCFVTVNGFHQAATNYIGQNVGAQHYDRVKRIFQLCFVYAGISGLLVGGSFFLFRREILGIYITDSAEAIACGSVRTLITTLPYFLYGFQDVAAGAMRGMGASALSMLISVLGVCGVRLLWVFTVFQMEPFHTPQVLYFSYPISWVLTMAVQIAAFVSVYQKQAHPARC